LFKHSTTLIKHSNSDTKSFLNYNSLDKREKIICQRLFWTNKPRHWRFLLNCQKKRKEQKSTIAWEAQWSPDLKIWFTEKCHCSVVIRGRRHSRQWQNHNATATSSLWSLWILIRHDVWWIEAARARARAPFKPYLIRLAHTETAHVAPQFIIPFIW
jgi:hypothetical protein